MRRHDKLLILCITFISVVALITVFANNQNPLERKPQSDYKPGVDAEADTAVNQAQKMYIQKKDEGDDFSDGHCLTNDLLPDWVADIVHVPRTAADNLEENQCQAFVEGRAHHFVELDSLGNVVRVY